MARKSRVASARLKDDEYRHLRQRAGKDGISVSRYIERLIEKDLADAYYLRLAEGIIGVDKRLMRLEEKIVRATHALLIFGGKTEHADADNWVKQNLL